eukprot:4807806-Pyramimonas_sp.AAC.1
MQCYVVFRCAMPCLQLQCWDMQWLTTQCHAMDASPTHSGSPPCSTSDCANREVIYAMVRAGSKG